MAKNDFIERFRNWSDEKLITSFKNRKDFQPDAVEAMIDVMKERKLGALTETIIATDKKSEDLRIELEKQDLKNEQKNYEEKMLGTNEDAVSFAKHNKDAQGVYAANNISSAKGMGWRYFLIMPATISITFFLFGMASRPLFNYAQEIFGVTAFLCVFYMIYSKIDSKASFQLYENLSRKTVFEIIHGNYKFEATVPFKYSVAAGEMEIRARGITITHPVLFLYVENNAGEKIRLTENLTALQTPPPAWPKIVFGQQGKDVRVFNEVFMEKTRLVRLKKILDGLHELKGNPLGNVK